MPPDHAWGRGCSLCPELTPVWRRGQRVGWSRRSCGWSLQQSPFLQSNSCSHHTLRAGPSPTPASALGHRPAWSHPLATLNTQPHLSESGCSQHRDPALLAFFSTGFSLPNTRRADSSCSLSVPQDEGTKGQGFCLLPSQETPELRTEPGKVDVDSNLLTNKLINILWGSSSGPQRPRQLGVTVLTTPAFTCQCSGPTVAALLLFTWVRCLPFDSSAMLQVSRMESMPYTYFEKPSK